MEALAIAALLALIGGVVFGRRPNHDLSESASRSDENPAELADRDPIEALLRYGTPADAARLIEQGIDLEANGYRPPQER